MSPPQQNSRTNLRSIANIAYSTIGLLASLVTVITVLSTLSLATLIAWLTQQKNIILPLVWFSLGFCSLLVIIILYLQFFSKSTIKNLRRGYKWVSAQHLYCIDDTLEQHIHISTIRIKIIRPGTIIFQDSYIWSGHGNEEPPEILSAGHELMGSFTKQHFYFKHKERRFYFIYLGRELPIGQEVEIKIRKKLHDNARRFEPFFSTPIGGYLRRLSISVRLPKSPHAMNFYNYHYTLSGTNGKLISKTPSMLTVNPDNIELSYEVLNVRSGRYEIRWEW
jgi:hypothetical protein